MIIHSLWHFRNFRTGDVLNLQSHGGVSVGFFRSRAKALAAQSRVAGKPGYDRRPDGFRLFALELDRDYWSQGFRPGPGGCDNACAGNGSGIFGNDEALAEHDFDSDRDPVSERDRLEASAGRRSGRQMWRLDHYKISAVSSQAFEDMGQKLVGLYVTAGKLEAAMARLSVLPGFADWPGGFRMEREVLDRILCPDGFAVLDGMTLPLWFVPPAERDPPLT